MSAATSILRRILACTDLAGKLRALTPSAATTLGRQSDNKGEMVVLMETRSLHDVLGWIQEGPVAAKLRSAASNTLDLADTDWPAPIVTDHLGVGGGIRFLSIVRPKTYPAGGNLADVPTGLLSVRNQRGDVEMNPRDELCLVLGMSLPITSKRV